MRNRWFVFSCSLGIIGLWLMWFIIPSFLINQGLINEDNLTNIGLLGDSFGNLSSLFSALAFIGVVYSIYMQNMQITEQKVEDSRRQFERELFRLIDLFEIAKGQVMYATPHAGGEKIHEGHEAFREMFKLLGNSLAKENKDHSLITEATIKENANGRFNIAGHNSLGPYFRILYNALRMISTEHSISVHEKEKYGNLIRSLLSEYELGILSISCLDRSSGNMKEYIVEFRLLKYLRQPTLRKLVSFHYPDTAFKGRDS